MQIGSKAVATGGRRCIFVHPLDPRLLLKVRHRNLRLCDVSGVLQFCRWLKDTYDRRILSPRELEEYRRLQRSKTLPSFLPVLAGTVRTNLGLALSVSAVRDPSGNLAPTLCESVLAGRLDGRLEGAIDEFLAQVMASPVVAADLHSRNIVYDEMHHRFMLVDGIGDKTFLPLRSWFAFVNRYSKKKYIRRLREEIRLLQSRAVSGAHAR